VLPLGSVLAVLLLPLLIGAVPGNGANAVRPSAISGSWYPDRACLISAEIDRMTRAAANAPALPGRPVALVVPHAGWRFSGFAAAAAYRTLAPGDFDRIVVVAPSHRGSFAGYSCPEVAAYRTPAGEVHLCSKAMKQLRGSGTVRTVPGVHKQEHAIEIEIPFLQERLDDFRLVPILAGQTDTSAQKALAAQLARLHDGRTLFVFSSDFTHYGERFGFTPYGPSARKARERIRALDERALGFFSPPDADGFRKFLEETSATICGREGLKVLLELLPRIAPEARPVRLAEYASIDMPGVKTDDSVSYVALAFVEGKPSGDKPLGAPSRPPTCPANPPPLSDELGGMLLRVARATLNTELGGTDDLRQALRDLPATAHLELHRLQGAFVTLNRTDPAEIKHSGRLRGCIGQVYPTYPLPEAVVIAAAKAALEDRRFRPVRAEELPRLEVELTVLSPPRPAASWKEIEIGRHGIVLKKGQNRAVYLPHVAVEQGWTVEETLSHLSRKAGLPANAWREGASFEIFEGQIFGEHRRKEMAHRRALP
jgi:AmmeMemoRadiSam system protein B/AmmeMemoRadiSam system protein A